jgi:hypothetical protein
VNLDTLEARFNVPAVKEDIARLDIPSVPVLLLCEVISEDITAFVTPADFRRQSDYFPVLEYVEQRALFTRQRATGWTIFDETERPRSATLLATYLKTHEPAIADIRAFVNCSAVHNYFSPRIIRSLVERWRAAHPADPEPAELLARLAPPDPSPDADADRLRPYRGTIWERAAVDPKPLVQFRGALWKSYLAGSSIFHVPPPDELLTALNRLLTTDSVNQRMYKLEFAKLAWDQGRDDDCIRFALNALDPAAPGSFDFDMNQAVVPEVISLVAEMAWRQEQQERALQLFRIADDAGKNDPRMAMIRRKLLASPAGALSALPVR